MAIGHVHKRGDEWRARYRGPDGKQRSKVFGTHREALAWLAAPVHSEESPITFGTFAAAWLVRQTTACSRTRVAYASLLWSRLLPEWGDVLLEEIFDEDVDDWAKRLGDELSPSRVAACVHLLDRILDDAEDAGFLSEGVTD